MPSNHAGTSRCDFRKHFKAKSSAQSENMIFLLAKTFISSSQNVLHTSINLNLKFFI